MLAGDPLLLGRFAQHGRGRLVGPFLGLAEFSERLLLLLGRALAYRTGLPLRGRLQGLSLQHRRLDQALRGGLGLDAYGFGLQPAGGEQLLGLRLGPLGQCHGVVLALDA